MKLSDHYVKIDFHVHTSYSDGDDIKAILHYAKNRGLDGLAITDHCTLKGYEKCKKLESEMLIIPGIEIPTEVGHVLVLGVKESFRCMKGRYVEIYDWALENNCIIVLAHPAVHFHKAKAVLYSGIKPHCIEVLNSMYPFYRWAVRYSWRLASSSGVTPIAGSDAHQASIVGCCYTNVFSEANLEEVLEALRRGRVFLEGGPAPLKYRWKIWLSFLLSIR